MISASEERSLLHVSHMLLDIAHAWLFGPLPWEITTIAIPVLGSLPTFFIHPPQSSLSFSGLIHDQNVAVSTLYRSYKQSYLPPSLSCTPRYVAHPEL